MTVYGIGVGAWFARKWRALFACTRGNTMIGYVTTLGVVALTGALAFAEFEDSVLRGLRSEMSAVAESSGDQSDGPVASLAQEVAAAGADQLVVQGSWALSAKAGPLGLAAARKTHRGRGAPGFKDERPGGSTPQDVSGEPPRDGPEQGGQQPPSNGETCRNGVCSGQDGTTCFVAGTPVATPSGPKPIEQLAPGDLVLSRDDDTGSFSEPFSVAQ